MLLRSVDAIYPEQHLAERRVGRVVISVTVTVDGEPSDARVVQSAGSEFDDAALAAVAAWRFAPARRADTVVPARIEIPFEFVPPPLEQAPSADEVAAEPATVPPDDDHTHGSVEVTVHGTRRPRTQERSASDFRIGRDLIEAAPRQEGAEVLRTAPGLYIGRGEGAAVAHSYMLRGFDAEHGQDIEFSVGGLPINLPSHIHGQGYADLGFLIAESVSGLDVSEGVYDPSQGDFAVAGSIDVQLGVPAEQRGVLVRSSYGSFDTFRQLALWAPPNEPDETLAAVSLARTDGFGQQRAANSGSAVFQQRLGEGERTFRAIGIVHAARAGLAGVVRRQDVDSGELCFHCAYPHATARGQNASAQRVMAGIFSDSMAERGDNGQLGAWVGFDDFRVQSNYTGFIESSSILPQATGRGDLIEQQNRTLSVGVSGRYRTDRFRPSPWLHGTLELGAAARLDDVEQSQNLIEAGRNETWDRRVDANVVGTDLGTWGDLDWIFTRYAHLRAGVRADLLSYTVDDRLGNFIEQSRPQDSYIAGHRRSAMGLAFGPRTSIELHPAESLSILAAYGQGYRSPQARMLEDGENAPFTKVHSADVGVHLDFEDDVHFALAGYHTQLSDDVAFDASEGRLERIGATRRLGAVAHVYTKPAPWFVGAASATFVHATLLEPPPATPEEPQPAFQRGQALPFVPPLVLRADAGLNTTLLDDLRGRPLGGRVGTGFSLLSARPLPYGGSAAPVSLLDASLALLWGPLELGFELFNLLDVEYAAFEYSFASDWDPNDGVRSRTPSRHIAAGPPLSWLLSLGVRL